MHGLRSVDHINALTDVAKLNRMEQYMRCVVRVLISRLLTASSEKPPASELTVRQRTTSAKKELTLGTNQVTIIAIH
jgi:hypothetical protein